MIVVYTYVCGDILHEGHVLYLENAKALGDKLIVGVLTDEAVMEKKPKPILPFPERLRLVGALKCVDCAVAQDTYSPTSNLDVIRPDIAVESASHDEDYDWWAEQRDIQVVRLPYYPVQSSTKIKESLKDG